MSVFIKLLKNEIKSSANYGRYVARTINMGEVTTAELAREIEANSTFKQGEVMGLLMELAQTMARHMQNGKTVVLDGIGRFHLAVESAHAESPADFSASRHVKRIVTKYVAAGSRNGKRNGHVIQYFADGATVSRLFDSTEEIASRSVE